MSGGMQLSRPQLLDAYERMVTIRVFEETMREEFAAGTVLVAAAELGGAGEVDDQRRAGQTPGEPIVPVRRPGRVGRPAEGRVEPERIEAGEQVGGHGCDRLGKREEFSPRRTQRKKLIDLCTE